MACGRRLIQHRRAVAMVAAVVALVAAEAGYRAWASTASTGSAEWIWAREEPHESKPLAFYLVRDFHLSRTPPTAPLVAMGDEEYVLYLNGRRVGSNIYRPGAPLDRFDVAPLLVAGGNRLVAEVRSRKGSGGFLLQLSAGGEELVVSDGAWKVLRRYAPGILGGWLPTADAASAQVWGKPPTGRWGHVTLGSQRPLFAARADSVSAAPPPSWSALEGEPLAWRALPEPFREPLKRAQWPRSWSWSEVVEGYVELGFEEGAPTAGLIYLNEAPVDRLAALPTDCLLSPPGAPRWSSAVPRRFSRVAVVAAKQPVAISVLPPPAGLKVRTAHVSEEGVLGIEPPPRASPLENEVLRLLNEAPR